MTATTSGTTDGTTSGVSVEVDPRDPVLRLQVHLRVLRAGGPVSRVRC